MKEENNTQKNNIQNPDTSDMPISPTTKPDLLTDEFFSQIKTSKKINEKRKKIDELTKSLQEDPSYLNSSENQQKITQLYDLLISNLNENNNNYVSSQMKLIETLINNNKNNENNQKFQNFAKQALPKLFDKFYLQNQKINDNLTGLLNKFIENKILHLQDYYPHIENISLEEEDNYRNNIMNLLNEQFTKNKNISLNEVPKGILDIVNKLSEDDDENVSDIAKKSLEILNQRKQEIRNEKDEEKNENKIDEKKEKIEEKNGIINKEEKNINIKIQENEIKEKENITENQDNLINKSEKENTQLINNNNINENKDNDNDNEQTKNEIINKDENKQNEDKEIKEEIKEEEKEKKEEIKEEIKEEKEKNEEEKEKNEEEKEKKEEDNDNNKKEENDNINKNEKEEEMSFDEAEEENQMTEIPLLKIDDDLLNIENTNNQNTDNANNNLNINQNEQNIKDEDILNFESQKENEQEKENDNDNNINDEKQNDVDTENYNINEKNKDENMDEKCDDNKIEQEQDKKDNKENSEKSTEIKNEEIIMDKKDEEDKKDLTVENDQIERSADKNIQNENSQNIDNQNKDEKTIIDNNKGEKEGNYPQQQSNEKENINEKNIKNDENAQIDIESNKKNENEKLNEKDEKNDLINTDKNENQHDKDVKDVIITENEKEKVSDNKEQNHEFKNNENTKDTKEQKESINEIKDNKKEEEKNDINIEKKESNTEIKDSNNNKKEEEKKEGGVKRSAIQGKLNKFRKQFGKTKKKNTESKEIKVDNYLTEKSDTKLEKENNIKESDKTIDDKNENKNIINDDIKGNEIRRTNTLEEMFKKKFEDGFDTETNNILDLGKSHNNNDNNNVLNEIQDKLGIDFNEIVTQQSESINNDNDNNNNNDENTNLNLNSEKKINDEKEITNTNNNIKKDVFNDTHDSKKFINPDDRPIHPSSSLNFNFELDFDEQEKAFQKKESNQEKSKKNNKKNIFDDQDLEELSKKITNNSKNNSNSSKNRNELNNSNNNDLSSGFDNKNNNINNNKKEVQPFKIDNFDENNTKILNDKDEINNLNNALNDLTKTINNLDNLNIMNNLKITKKVSLDERRPKIKTDDFQKKLEMALEQEQAGGEQGPSPSDDNDKNEKDKEKSEKFKEDPRFDTIKSILGKEIVDSLFSQRWEDKKHGYELINNFLESNDISSTNSNDLYEYIRIKLKKFKETNFNVNREALNVFITMTKKNLMNKDNLITIISTYYDKITDTKLKDNYLELLNLSITSVEPNTILKQLLPKISKKNNVKLFIEYSIFFGKIIEDYNNKELPYKEITDFCKIMANNNNPQSRNAGTNLICILYKYYGEEIHKLITDIKESTLKNIEGELAKVTIVEKKSAKKIKTDKKRVSESINNNININGGEKEINGGGNGETKQNVISDISKKITPQILKDISDGKWAEKKDAIEQIEKILNEANMKIAPTGLNDLMNLIKKKLTDGNKNIVRMMVNLLAQLIEALKHGFKQWAKYIALNLIQNLSDKNQILRNECQICFDKWVEFVGFDTLIIYFPSFLKNDNVEIRTEIMNFISKYKNKFNKEIGVPVFKEMANNLLLCLQDRSVAVRTQAEEIIKLSLNYIKLSNYYNKIKEFKPAITNDLKIILDKIQSEINDNNASTTNQSETTNNTNTNNNDNNSNIKNDENKNNNDENDVDFENININELINSNSNNNSNNKNNNGNGATSQRSTHKANQKKDESFLLKSNSTILGNDSGNKLSLNSNNNGNVKYKKNINKNKIRNSLYKSVNTMSSENKSKDKDVLEKANKTKEIKTLINYKTCTNFNKKKTLEKNISPPKSAKKEPPAKIKNKNERHTSTLSESFDPNIATNFNTENPKSERSKIGFNKIKGISNSLILKKTDKKGKKDTNSVFLTNYKVVPNKLKRLDKDLKFKFSLDYISRDSSVKSKLKDMCKNLFTEDFSKKIFSDDFKKQVMALKEMKEQLDKKINIPIYFDNLDLILKIIGINLNGNINATLAKNLIEFLDALYNNIVEKGQMLNEIESNIIISLLIDKLSISNNTLKELLFQLLNKYIELNGINKIMALVFNIALGKNSKIKTDILDFAIDLYNNKKLNIISKTYVKILGKYICSNDNIVKSKVLVLFREIFAEIGDELFSYLDFLTDKDREYLENNLELDNEGEFDEEEEVEIDNQHLGGMNSSDEELDDNNDSNNNKNNQLSTANNSNINVANGAVILENELLTRLNNLNNKEIRLNTIILLHEMICGKYENNKHILIPNIDNIINTFIKVAHELFISSDIHKLEIKFAKYLSTVLLKIVSNKELISNLSYKLLYDLTNELLSYLLIQDFDKIGEKQEGFFIFKSINSAMIRVMDNCDRTSVIIALLQIVKNCQNSEDKKMGQLALKCLLKSTDNLGKFINSLNIGKIFNELHIILVKYEKMYPELKNKNQGDTYILRFIQNFITDIVKFKSDTILDIYNNSVKKSEIEDEYIIHWIQNALDSIHKIDKNLNISQTINNMNNNNNNNNESSDNKKKDDLNINEQEQEKKSEEKDDKKDNVNKENNNNTIDQLKKKWNDIKTK